MNEQFYERLAAAYYRGLSLRTGQIALPARLLDAPLEALTQGDARQIIALGRAVNDRLYYFKRTHENLPRVRRTLGFLHAVQFESLLDVGSGRGVFLLPFLARFPHADATSMDILPHRVQLWRDMRRGGVTRLTAINADITAPPPADKAYDVVTMLEVLEHIPQVERAVASAVAMARKHVVVTVPNQADNNPEHIHFLTKTALARLFEAAGCPRLRFDAVSGHLFLVATVTS